MTIVRTTRFQVRSADAEEMQRRREALIAAVRDRFPGLGEARLTRVDATTWVDSWVWASREELEAALAGAPSIDQAGPAFALTTDVTAENGELIDVR